MITNIFEERKRNPEIHKGDFLDEILADMKTETFLTDKFIIYMMSGLLLASFETISSTLTLAIKLIGEHPKVVQELTVSDTYMCQILPELGLKNVFFLCVCVCLILLKNMFLIRRSMKQFLIVERMPILDSHGTNTNL